MSNEVSGFLLELKQTRDAIRDVERANVLDFVAKTPVWEIHLFDGDKYLQHNAFRSPGAPSLDELTAQTTKATWFKNIYSKMHSGIVDLSRCGKRREVARYGLNIPFVDVGMGIQVNNSSLGGIVRVTTKTKCCIYVR